MANQKEGKYILKQFSFYISKCIYFWHTLNSRCSACGAFKENNVLLQAKSILLVIYLRTLHCLVVPCGKWCSDSSYWRWLLRLTLIFLSLLWRFSLWRWDRFLLLTLGISFPPKLPAQRLLHVCSQIFREFLHSALKEKQRPSNLIHFSEKHLALGRC